MRWQQGPRSENVEDRRGMRGPVMVGGGVGLLAIILIVLCLGGDPQALLQVLQQQQQQGGGVAGPVDPAQKTAEDQQVEFVRHVLGQTEEVWTKEFAQLGKQYQKPKLIVFSNFTDSACGTADKAVGPFYCPGDQQVYIDLSFFKELETKYEAGGDSAQAYVIAHEIGHHVQNLLGISDQVHDAQRRMGHAEANDLSVRLELQADFLAGVWAHHASQNYRLFEEGDILEAMRAAQAIGDDKLQMKARGFVVPDSFTHGSSEQRVRWFLKGLRTGDIEQGDTFSAQQL
ncbi:MAG: neutral zinc metallopeptidase [Planctomycetaceae bacterium]|nr:neutral zinc metallopeptidase [Planctomycetaceae bacterium]